MVRNLENFQMPGGSDAAGGLEEVEGEFFGERGGGGGGGHFLGGFGGFLVDEMDRGGMDGDIL